MYEKASSKRGWQLMLNNVAGKLGPAQMTSAAEFLWAVNHQGA